MTAESSDKADQTAELKAIARYLFCDRTKWKKADPRGTTWLLPLDTSVIPINAITHMDDLVTEFSYILKGQPTVWKATSKHPRMLAVEEDVLVAKRRMIREANTPSASMPGQPGEHTWVRQ